MSSGQNRHMGVVWFLSPKVENCQVGVFAAYAAPHGYVLVDKRLFIPEQWFTKDYAVRMEKCKVADDLQFKTKPQLAAEMFREIEREGILPFRYVAADSIYGNSPEFIEAVEGCGGVTYFVSIPSDTLCWLREPVIRKKQYRYKGRCARR